MHIYFVYTRYIGSPHGYSFCSQSSWRVLVAGRGAGWGAAGPVVCGGLWAMTAVDSSSSSSAMRYVAHTWCVGVGLCCCGERGVACIYSTKQYSRSLLLYVSTASTQDRPASRAAPSLERPRSCAYDGHKPLPVCSSGVVFLLHQ